MHPTLPVTLRNSISRRADENIFTKSQASGISHTMFGSLIRLPFQVTVLFVVLVIATKKEIPVPTSIPEPKSNS
jgi:hypothetical protein